MTIAPKVFKSKPRKRKIIANGCATAADMIGPIEYGCEIFGLTGGQYSFIDILEHCLNNIGPAHCMIATWTASYASIEKAKRFCGDSRLLSCTWMVDNSFVTRKPELCKQLVSRFGYDCIRTCPSHAKFLLLWNDDWNIVIRTSMNLNQNKRVESFEISDDAELMNHMRESCARIGGSVGIVQKRKKRKTEEEYSTNASQIIGSIDSGCEIVGLTDGEFSFVDIIEHCLDEIGGADCIVSTWTASQAHLDRIKVLKESESLRSCRWIIDRSFRAQKPKRCNGMLAEFGKDSVRTASTHSKFALLWNDTRAIVIRTSMNLNHNPRCEDFEISDDKALLGYMRGLCETVFKAEGENNAFTTKNETEKITSHFKTGDLWEGKLSLNTAPLSLNV